MTSVDPASVTLTASYQPLWSAAFSTPLGPNYFNWVGKAVKVRAFGRYTTGATPGNIAVALWFGDGTAGNGTNIAGVAFAGSASQTAQSWLFEMVVRCRGIGTSGLLHGTGWLTMQGLGVFLVQPNSSSAATVDTTANGVLTVQANRSGSTAETMQAHDVMFEALN